MATLQTANANYYTWHRQVPARHGLVAPTGGRSIFQCRDQRWVSFVVPPPFWDAFVSWLKEEGIESALASEAWRDLAYRLEHAGAITDAIEQLVARLDREALFHEGQRRRLLVMPVNTVDDLLADDQLRERDFFVSVEHPELGRTLTDSGVPYRMSRTPVAVTRRAPLLGEHNDEVYRDLLGLSDAELVDLRAEGVV
jgi:crotonobetainyl-CoA:carnitine CoA-transferase CaiB-like acyl-CoA transferase